MKDIETSTELSKKKKKFETCETTQSERADTNFNSVYNRIKIKRSNNEYNNPLKNRAYVEYISIRQMLYNTPTQNTKIKDNVIHPVITTYHFIRKDITFHRPVQLNYTYESAHSFQYL